MVSPEKAFKNKIMIIYVMKAKTLLKIMLTMIPLMMMTKVNKNSDFLAFSDFITFSDFFAITPKYHVCPLSKNKVNLACLFIGV